MPDIEEISHLVSLGNDVSNGYEYYEKLITPGQDLSLQNAYLKWYNIRRPDLEIAPELTEESRAFLTAEVERLKIKGELGFVILHHCGPMLLLLLTTWRNTNEMWEVVYAKDTMRAGSYEAMTYENDQRGTYCVWELGVVWHERNAWVHFLASKRDKEAKLAYVNSRFSGLV